VQLYSGGGAASARAAARTRGGSAAGRVGYGACGGSSPGLYRRGAAAPSAHGAPADSVGGRPRWPDGLAAGPGRVQARIGSGPRARPNPVG
jgi:hypothetical protein